VRPASSTPTPTGTPLDDPAFPNFLAMGVTTIVLGQDGGSPEAATSPAHLDAVDAARPRRERGLPGGAQHPRGESGVGTPTRPPRGRAGWPRWWPRAWTPGAFGLSTGLEYDPGVRADLDELVAMARPVAERAAWS
jgi:N-acyl-D-amino-acid deacylase